MDDWEIYEIFLFCEPGSLEKDLQPRLVSYGPGGKFHPRYSPDGGSLAFVVDFDGSENFHIILHNLATAKQTDLTAGITSAIQASFAWSPDNEKIAFISDQSGRFDVYVVSVARWRSTSSAGCRVSGLEGVLVAGRPLVGGDR